MKTVIEIFEIQIDEKPNGAVIRINDATGCMIRICSVPRELVFDEEGKVRSFVDITYPKQMTNYERAMKVNKLSKLGLRFKKL